MDFFKVLGLWLRPCSIMADWSHGCMWEGSSWPGTPVTVCPLCVTLVPPLVFQGSPYGPHFRIGAYRAERPGTEYRAGMPLPF